jgi:hypothetical protein
MDLVINEILFDPLEGGVDFVEIYNRSARFYDLSDLVMATIDTFSLQVTDTESVTGDSFLIAPGDYKVMTTDPWAVMSHYNCPDPDAFIRMTALPPMGNEAGNIVLALKNDGTVIDRVDYTSSLHFSLIRDTDGVSLERVHYDRPSGDPGNWHSAAETVGFATPGYQNSQYSMVPPEREDPFFIDPGTFSPDNDGIEDVLNIRYRFSTPGNMVSILIFDSMGRLVKTLINNTLAGTEGVFSWDGSLDRVSIGSDGIYIIFARVFTLSGNTEEYKNVCVLRSRRDQ